MTNETDNKADKAAEEAPKAHTELRPQDEAVGHPAPRSKVLPKDLDDDDDLFNDMPV